MEVLQVRPKKKKFQGVNGRTCQGKHRGREKGVNGKKKKHQWEKESDAGRGPFFNRGESRQNSVEKKEFLMVAFFLGWGLCSERRKQTNGNAYQTK